MLSDQALIDGLRGELSGLNPRDDLIESLRERAERDQRRRFRLIAWRPRFHAGSVMVALGAGCALAVAIVALAALGHHAPGRATSSASAGVHALEARLAVLRRAQTAADRTFFRILLPRRRRGAGGVVPGLVRLATTVNTPTGPVRVYVIVRRVPAGSAPGPSRITRGDYFVSAVTVDARGRILANSGFRSASNLVSPGAVGSGMRIAGIGVNPNVGVNASVVPDNVTRVKWVFTGAGFGISHFRPVTVYPRLHDNVAVAASTAARGPLAKAVWYDTTGRVVAAATANPQAQFELQRIRSVNASRARAIAPYLIAHFALFRTVAADDPIHDPAVPTPTDRGIGLNDWQTRFLPSLTGLDGPGLWITPGTLGLCISDPQVSSCEALTSRNSTVIFGGSTNNGHQVTIAGLVIDGNPTIRVVLADGTQRTIPVTDNAFETTVPGRIIAIIARNRIGRLERQTLG